MSRWPKDGVQAEQDEWDPSDRNGEHRDCPLAGTQYFDDEYDEYDDYPEGCLAPGRKKKLTRRGFLGVAGASTGAAVLAGVPAVSAAGNRRNRDRNDRDGRDDGDGRNRSQDSTQFGRLFGDLPPFAESSEELTAALTELGRPGGLLDANDPLDVGPIRLITEPELSPDNPDNLTHTAGSTFVGQFIDHDLTRDASGATLGRAHNIRRSANLRTPRLDLDSVYGGGPTEMPEMYTSDPIRFIVESGGQFEDLPRDGNNQAIIGDPRNDENLVISGLQAAFLLFHNAVADQVEAMTGLTGIDAFEETRRLVRWHWQWIVINEFLPQYVGQAMVDDVRNNGARFFNPNRLQIPVEFQGAAYRFGHSMVRPSYRANLAGDDGEPFFAMVFDPNLLEGPDPDTLLGGYRAPRRFIGWQTFFDFGDGEVKPNKKIDTSISTPLFQLPIFAIDSARGDGTDITSLATRNLLRHLTWQLPSGQAVAGAMGAEPVAAADMADIGAFGANLDASTPLWLYSLREAEVMADGNHLGPVGGRIVAETLLTLMGRDDTGFLGAEPGWRPTLSSATADGGFRMTDLLRLAGVDPASRGQ